jgi:hypothetical protein
MPPCHGGDRRFESGQIRQIKSPSSSGVFYLASLIRIRTRRCTENPCESPSSIIPRWLASKTGGFNIISLLPDMSAHRLI